MDSAVRLDRAYDVARLRADLVAAEREGKGHLHSGPYQDGGWSAIPLVSVDGDTGPRSLYYRAPHSNVTYRKTTILARCPYFEEIIESFQCPKQRIRLMRLEPGKHIHAHSDGLEWSWPVGRIARFHIPIVTHEDVEFVLDGKRLNMRPGELWYCDFSRVHRVANRSDIARVHLVMDFVINDWLRSQFRRESIRERAWNTAYRLFYRSGAARVAVQVERALKRKPRPPVVQD